MQKKYAFKIANMKPSRKFEIITNAKCKVWVKDLLNL